ncbi:MAG: DUF1810 domain-containing protein [Coriobacteriales bacterium]
MSDNDTYNLKRFLDAQQGDYEQALSEIRSGRKRSHWIWYVFPQLEDLGRSGTAKYYGISGAEEARAYLADPVLGARLREISAALLTLDENNPSRVMGYPDDLKLRSCMTLFDAVSDGNEEDSVFSAVLDKFYGGEPDSKTLHLLGISG